MTDSSRKILELINEGKTANEIADTLGISNKVLYNRLTMLRNGGYDFLRKFYYDGNIRYCNIDEGSIFYSNNEVDLITKNNSEIDIVVISDLHFGSICERRDLLDKLYDYCVKNGIHIIIVSGDLVNGNINSTVNSKDVEEHINYFIKTYPFDKSIVNFCVLGDHDFSASKESKKSFITSLNNYRHDIVSLGYYLGKINVQDDFIVINHGKKENYPGNRVVSDIKNEYHKTLIIKGHSHQQLNVNYDTNNNIVINVPPFCDLHKFGTDVFSNAIKVKLSLNSYSFNYANITPLYVSDKVYEIMDMGVVFNSKSKNKKRNLINTIE